MSARTNQADRARRKNKTPKKPVIQLRDPYGRPMIRSSAREIFADRMAQKAKNEHD